MVYICSEAEIYIAHIHLLKMHLFLTFLGAETFVLEYSILFSVDIPSEEKVLWFIHCKVSLLKCQRLRNEKYWYTHQNVSCWNLLCYSLKKKKINWTDQFIVTTFRQTDCNLACLYRMFWGWIERNLINKQSSLCSNMSFLSKIFTAFIFGVIIINSD